MLQITLWAQFHFKHGDLIFQQLDCGKFCNAINKVTPAFKHKHFNHVGMVVRTDSGCYILEAISQGVVLTRIDSFLNRTTIDNMLLARVPRKYVFASSDILPYLQKPYDAIFDMGNNAYYCSELAYHLYKTKKGKHFFTLHPMTFKDPETGKYHPLWIQYFKELQTPIPEGKPGLNPGSMLHEKGIKVKKVYHHLHL